MTGKQAGLSHTGGWVLVGSSIRLRICVCERGKSHQLTLLKSRDRSKATDHCLSHIYSETNLEEAVRFADHMQSQHETVG